MGRVYLGAELGAVAAIINSSWLHVQARGGVSLDVDAAQLYGGARFWLGGKRFSLELDVDARYAPLGTARASVPS